MVIELFGIDVLYVLFGYYWINLCFYCYLGLMSPFKALWINFYYGVFYCDLPDILLFLLESDLLDSIYVGGLSFKGLSNGGGEGIWEEKSSGFFKLNLFFEAISSYNFSLYSFEENFWLSSIASVITLSDVGSSSSLWNLYL